MLPNEITFLYLENTSKFLGERELGIIRYLDEGESCDIFGRPYAEFMVLSLFGVN